MKSAHFALVLAAAAMPSMADELAVGESTIIDGVKITRLPDDAPDLTNEQLQALCNARSRVMADAAAELAEGYDFEISVSLKSDGTTCTSRVERATDQGKVN